MTFSRYGLRIGRLYITWYDRWAERSARWLVRWASRSINASYSAYARRDSGEVPKWWPTPWHFYARRVCRIALPLARRFDTELTVTQMIEESWWG